MEDTVGAVGISQFGDPGQNWRAYGYPADDPFDGERLFTCDSRPTTFDFQLEPPPIGIGLRHDRRGEGRGRG